jgi:hypothetical protein
MGARILGALDRDRTNDFLLRRQALYSAELRGRETGVSDGVRTRDLLDHNQALCQLSYTHHAAHTTFVRRRLEPDTGIDPVTSFLPRTRSATELIGRCPRRDSNPRPAD